MQPCVLTTHSHTPKLIVIEPRGLTIRSVDYYRASPGDTAETRVNRTAHDPAGWAIAQWDPRLFQDASAPANLHSIHSQSGAILASTSVDAGLRISLLGEAGQLVHLWDGRGSQRRMHYDDQLRLNAIFEQAVEGEADCTERLSYAASDQAFAIHNQCGRLIRHDDPSGALLFNDYGLTGAVLEQVRCMANERTAGYPTLSRVNPLGELLSRTDAQGNEQRFSQTLDGLLHAVDLHLNNSVEHLPMVNAITYNAHGQVEQEVAGNGVVTTLEYAAEDGRLKRLLSRLAQSDPLQDLRYLYDPVGNVSSIEDAALPIRYFANQRIEPVSHYRYDTLYRLIEATGWEAGAVKHGPSSAASADPAMPGNYRQTYRYDDGNNLLELTHVGPQNPGHRLVAAAHSNRCLPVRDGIEPDEEDFRSGFDANGNLLKLQPGQTLSWDVRNQLREVRPVERDSGLDDYELYFYGADGMRVRKVRSLQTNAKTIVSQTLYLPGLEIRTHSGTGEELHVIEVATGRGNVRVLHWEKQRPTDITNNQQRYSLTDHLGSSTLELDQDAKIITQERYYPFGGTAWSNGETVQVSYKTVRYSGKEQDATGLYYYGFRYYAAWLQRWLNPDPAGSVDGLNFFHFIDNSPVVNIDPNGLDSKRARGLWKFAFQSIAEGRAERDIITIAPGIIGVALFGGAEVFEQAGISLSRPFKGERSLFYLSIDASYEGRIVGGDRPVSLKSASAAGLNAAIGSSGAKWVAFMNGGFYNHSQLVDVNSPPWASVGTSFIDGEYKQSVPIPSDYVEDYVDLQMSNGSFIQTGPVLAREGQAVFNQQHLEDARFQFCAEMNYPGRLGHSNRPNNRSGISMPSEQSEASRTRLVIGLGRGRNDDSPGFTMPEWAEVMARIDRLNDAPGWSVNLDGGDSSALGVIDQSNVVLMDAGAPGNKGRGTSNFIAFSKKA
ncbi:RHS repeat-associated core domain-containing protein [Pseudomonas silesiensis]|uniref:RHS repeat domain-containing protein n=1 Tax=Pseudomonas silesiensis TaxID=1853130 RepID=UPI0030DA1298